jgi:hypothetical protein
MMAGAMAVEKIAASFSPELLSEIRRSAGEGATSISAWLSDAAQLKLRRHRATALLVAYEQEHGEITETELAPVQTKWPA